MRFSAVGPQGQRFPVRRGDVWMREPASGRLAIATDGDPLALLLDLTAAWTGPFKVLLVLADAAGDYVPGRYESDWLDRAQMESFFRSHAVVLAGSGSHGVWLASPVEERQIVWDRHEILYAHGALDEVEAALRARGFRQGEVATPAAHAHDSPPELAGATERMLAERGWHRWPLGASDTD